MKIVVTGAAGFIGSHLCETLVALGHDVIGADRAASGRSGHLKGLIGHPRFRLLEADLLQLNLAELVEEADVVFHLAGLPGVRASWGAAFEAYLAANVLVTQRLLEACKESRRLRKLVYASTSSVYGDGSGVPIPESAPTRPISPYGLTKLAGEQLCRLYHREFGVPYTALRYFTVYGPRQRPDMAFHRFMRAALLDQPLPLYGDGTQMRDFTYVSDLVQANIAAMNYDRHDTVFNVGGAAAVSLSEVLAVIERLAGRALRIERLPSQPGDPHATRADISLARRELGYEPAVALEDGLKKQWTYMRQLHKEGGVPQ